MHNYFDVEIGNDVNHCGPMLDNAHAIDKESEIEPEVILGR